jgi:NTE family protein
MSDVQLHRSNANTLTQFRESMQRWSDELSSDELQVRNYLVEIDFKSIPEAKRRFFFNQIPVSLSLQPEQVKALTRAGRELLLDNAVLHQFIDEFNARRQ